MQKIISLDKIYSDKEVKIYSINKNSKLKRRFLDLGITPNSYIKYEFKSPFNNPKAYLIKGSTIAIRNEDAKDIMVIYHE